MKTLEMFLRALEKALGKKNGYYYPSLIIVPLHNMPAYKKYTLKVVAIDNLMDRIYSEEESTDKVVTADDRTMITNRLVEKTMFNMLRYYGL